MILWDETVLKYEEQIDKMSVYQKFCFSLFCIDSSLIHLGEEFKLKIDISSQQTIEESLTILHGVKNVSFTEKMNIDTSTLMPKLHKQIEITENCNNPPGLYDILMALLITFEGLEEGFCLDFVTNIASCAYQAIFDQQIISSLTTSVLESETLIMEKNNPTCIKVITEQIKYIENCDLV